MKNFTFGGLKPHKWGKGTQFKKIETASYRTVVPTHTKNFSILAQLESVQKSGELKLQKKTRHFGSNYSDFLSPIKTLKFDIRIFAIR